MTMVWVVYDITDNTTRKSVARICFDIPQNEGSRFKVIKGREVHEEKRITNPEYLRKKLGVVKKELNAFIASKKNHIKGIVDEVLFLDDGTAAPFEYKFAEFKI